jgi:opacity protein-like surface antigen
MKKLFFLGLLGLWMGGLWAQDDLMDLLDEMEAQTTEYTYATFKTIRVVNAHSIETSAPGVLTLNIAHRFGALNSGFYDLFGLDQANMRFEFQYGLTDWLALGVGRSNIRKMYDGYLKLKLLRQSTGQRTMPLSLVYAGGTQLSALRPDPTRDNLFASRLAYTHQLLIARKFNPYLSLQLMPTLVHRNLVSTRADQNDVWSIGAGGRVKVSPSVTINLEYFYLLPGYTADNFQNSLSLGIDIETGGHVFQLVFSNSRTMNENLFIAETEGDWATGGIHFGFNLTRVFTVDKRGRMERE